MIYPSSNLSLKRRWGWGGDLLSLPASFACYTATLRAELRMGTLRAATCIQGCTDLLLSSDPSVFHPFPSSLSLSLLPSRGPGAPASCWKPLPRHATNSIRGQLDSRAKSSLRWCLFVYLPWHPKMRQLISKFLP